jgi:hypothetical protein
MVLWGGDTLSLISIRGKLFANLVSERSLAMKRLLIILTINLLGLSLSSMGYSTGTDTKTETKTEKKTTKKKGDKHHQKSKTKKETKTETSK